MKNEFRNWSDLRMFLAVYRAGSTLAASHRLGMSQPTVARRIEVLEHETGLDLFERDTRGYKPTGAAQALYPFAEALEQSAGRFFSKVQELSERKPIRITAPSFFSDRNMAALSEFNTLHPDISIEFVHSIRLLNLREGEADIAFRVSDGAPDESLICRRIGTEHMALCGGHSYARRFGLPTSPEDLRGHRFVSFRHRDVPDILHDWMERYVSADQIVTTFSDIELMYSAIRAGNGLGLVHARWADEDDTLIRCFDNIEELSRPVTMLISPDAHRREEVRVFTKFFAPRFAATFK